MRSGIPTAARPPRRARARKAGRSRRNGSKPSRSIRFPISSRRSFARSVDRPPAGEGWGHEIKFDGYRMQLRVEDGKVTLKTRKGLDWTEKFGAIAKEAQCAAGRADRRRDRGARPRRRARISRRCRPRSPTARPSKLIFFAFDLLFAEDMDLRRLPLRERKARLKEMLDEHGKSKQHPLCRAFRGRRRCRAGIGARAVARRHHLEEARRALSFRPHRELDQGEMRARARRS